MSIRSFTFVLSLFSSVFLVGQDDLSVLRTYLQEVASAKGLTAMDVQQWRVTDRPSSKAAGTSIIHVVQMVNGLDVHNAMGTFAVQQGKVVHFSDRFVRDLASKAGSATPGLSATDAVVAAAQALGITLVTAPTILRLLPEGVMELSPSGIAHGPIQARLLYQPGTEGTVRLAWDLTIRSVNNTNWWHLAVDANTGALLRENDYIVDCQFPHEGHAHRTDAVAGEPELPLEDLAGSGGYRVFNSPVESPSHGPRTLVVDPADALASPFGWHDVDGVDGAEYTITRGNNVLASEDVNNVDLPGYSPDGGASLDFDFPLNLSQAPATYQDAAITNLFFWNNLMHDVWYGYGFDEQSGNFQENNYDRGGEGLDQVIAEGQDGGGTNNANFGTPPDGQNGRMQMYNWTGASLANNLTVNAPGTLAGSYFCADAGFGPGSPLVPLTGDLVIVEDDLAPTQDGCSGLVNAAQISGRFALIDRGNCSFVIKVEAAQNAGAIGVIVVNNQSGAPTSMGGTSGIVNIPAVMVSDVVGAQLRNALNAGNTVNITLQEMGQSSDRDGCFDNGVIAHEYGHGISTRLTGGGNNVDCLFNAEQMGEGWSDWVGLMLTMESGDQAADVRGIGTFASGQAITAIGIRPAAYSTDLSVNDYTYAATNDVNGISQPHGIGFVWCTMLWDMTWALVDEYGFDEDLYTGTGGNNIAMQLVIEALKIQPCSPGFVDGRDAILAADELLYGGANRCLIWSAFARRGLGFSAQQGSSDDRADQVEAFDLPPVCQIPTAAPTADFDFLLVASCSGTVNFIDASTNIPQSWSWDLGDGNTSNVQNPSHTYASSGTYTVTLTTGNALGSDTYVQQVVITLPPAPVAEDAQACAGEPAVLTAQGSGELYWFNAQGEEVATGGTFTTPALSATTTYSVRNLLTSESVQVGPLTGAFGTGAYHGTTFVGTVNFTAFAPFTIVSCWVDAGAAGDRTLNLWSGSNGTGTLLQSVVVNIPAGPGRIDLGFSVPGPGSYSIGGSNVNLYRNDTGAEYPYSVPGLVTITGSPASSGHYYYLYDLEVAAQACASEAVEVTVNVDGAAFTYTEAFNVVSFTDASTGATSWSWDFGDGTGSTDQNPVHTYAFTGSYTITLTINGSCSTQQVWELTTGVDAPDADASFNVLPNPASDRVTVVLGAPAVEGAVLELLDVDGRLVHSAVLRAGDERYTWSVQALASGTYVLGLRQGDLVQRRSLLIAH